MNWCLRNDTKTNVVLSYVAIRTKGIIRVSANSGLVGACIMSKQIINVPEPTSESFQFIRGSENRISHPQCRGSAHSQQEATRRRCCANDKQGNCSWWEVSLPLLMNALHEYWHLMWRLFWDRHQRRLNLCVRVAVEINRRSSRTVYARSYYKADIFIDPLYHVTAFVGHVRKFQTPSTTTSERSRIMSVSGASFDECRFEIDLQSW